MEMVVWNQDTEDWSLTETPPPTTTDVIAGQMKTWLNGQRYPISKTNYIIKVLFQVPKAPA
jgi:hypothetical protein